jgi:diaminopimelate decarboxylase
VTIFDVVRPPRDGAAPAEVLRHYRAYRKAFSWAGITCDAESLRRPEVAAQLRTWVYSVDVRSRDELAFVSSTGVPASRMTLLDDGITTEPIRCAVDAGVGRLVLGCRHRQVEVVAAWARRPQRVLVDVTTGCACDTIGAVLERPRLNLVGLHATVAPEASATAYSAEVTRMIARMARIRREHDVILTRVSLAGGGLLSDVGAATSDLRGFALELEDAFDESCARHRFPRPAMILAVR